MTLLMAIMSFVIFAMAIGVMIFIFSRVLKQSRDNQKAPELSVYATVVSKRMRVMNEITSYFATFQVDSGDRMEFHLTGNDYAMLAEGDYGQLSFKGTEFLEFVRK
ncbi:MAG: DUF2500 domain-containing protein [Lachnospiraceae bacterium]|nr:DUF2500 domain-containing protein [Lachnospiraceae bacterium]